MNIPRKTWLVVNPDSGSYDRAAFDALCDCCTDQAIDLDRVIRFPKEDLPSADELDAAGIDLVTIFTGDGTINALVTGLYGWGGSVLILPGGTMNLLSIRLHGDVSAEEIVCRVASGQARAERPAVVRSGKGDALAGLMVGPGTAWNDVREAMRQGDILAMAGGAAEALGESTGGTRVRVVDPAIGKEEGYPLIVMTPEGEKMSVAAYHSETVGEYAQQGVALVKRDFREGPHDDLGTFEAMTMDSAANEPLKALIDGEPATLPARARFAIVPCEVDLLVTAGATPDD
ncbi:diacylglycerol/lipid kinase family protein [Croceicoccus bisphenolivorans]|uniref:diacylglycerol/lipid kinase family protein n=1 Tax=Croceicoccus bisphenolivorans TaxID=1783232 RepID=UPI00082EFC86|nr:diacylglycerol kinase family protein [Croceicoccus bisphenolivorans]